MRKNTAKIISLILALIFLLQSVGYFSVIPIQYALDFLGIGKGILEIAMAIFYLSIAVILVGVSIAILHKRKMVNEVTKNTIILNLIVRLFMMLIIFLPAFLSFSFLGHGGFFGQKVYISLQDKTLSDIDQVMFLNFYLFWYLLITAFVKPEIVPEWGTNDKSQV